MSTPETINKLNQAFNGSTPPAPTVTVTWQSVPNANEYRIYLDQLGVGRYATYAGISGSTNSYEIVLTDTALIGTTLVVTMDALVGAEYLVLANSSSVVVADWRAPFTVNSISLETGAFLGQAVITWGIDDSVGFTTPLSFSIEFLDDTDMVIHSFTAQSSPFTTDLTTYPVNIAKVRITAKNNSFYNVTAEPVEKIGPWTVLRAGPEVSTVDLNNVNNLVVYWSGLANVITYKLYVSKYDSSISGYQAITGSPFEVDGGVSSFTTLDYTASVGEQYRVYLTANIDTEGDTAAGTLFDTTIQASGGGGGGGGGGNNGGNGHNTMATLEFSYDEYSGAVTQTNTITVLGEEGGALPTVYDTIVVDVTPDELSSCLAYKGTWPDTTGEETGGPHVPDVKFLPVLACGTKLQEMYALLSSKGSGAQGGDGRKFLDSAGAQKERFGEAMLGITFTNSWLDDDELPREAIRAIDEGEIVAPPLASGAAESVVKDLDSTSASASASALLKGLFEQAVAANKIRGDAVAGNNQGAPAHSDAALAADNWKQAQFAEDDSITFLVNYTFTKTRDYVIDGDATAENSGNTAATSKTITVAGVDYEIVAQNEVSDVLSRKYAIKLRAKSAPTAPAAITA